MINDDSREADAARVNGIDEIPAEEDQTGKAWTIANLQIDAVRSLVARAPDKFALLLSPKNVDANIGRIMLPMGMENGAPIGDDLAKVQYFFDRGVRYITLCHGEDNRIADSSYVKTARWGGPVSYTHLTLPTILLV